MRISFLLPTRKASQNGSAMLLTMILSGVALALLAGALSWSAGSTRLTYRSIQYNRSQAAAEAATDKVVSQITRDFLYGSENLVVNNLNTYRSLVPQSSDSSYWTNWVFNDTAGDLNQTYVQRGTSISYISLNAPYTNLQAFVSTYTIVSDAKDTASPQDLTVGVLQQIQLASIPIFQFAMYSSGNMEISCGQPFDITGPVHSNGHLYIEPDSSMKFESGVTAVIDILFQRDPLDTRGSPAGSVVYVQPSLKQSPVGALTLPIGTTNTPEAIREIIEPPPSGEDPTSPIGQLRYNFQTVVPTNQLQSFISTSNSFYDARENKTVLPIDLNIGNLTAWSQTNSSLRTTLIGSNLSSVYVVDNRTPHATTLGAVRVVNGRQLPPSGLTVATARPLYVLGDYNQTNNGNMGTTNTSTTRPASLAADAITILSDNWTDANSTSPVASRVAASTTVNAAFLTGVVETTYGNYSVWGLGNVYDPPARNWAFDLNFNDPTKLPPKTPSLLKVIRNKWASLAAGQNTPP